MKRFLALLIWLLLMLPFCAMAESSVISMEASGNTVRVQWRSDEDAMLSVDIVGDGQTLPCASKAALVSGEEETGEAVFVFDDLPDYFSIETYFVSPDSGAGGDGSTVFVEDLYTKPIQELIRADENEYADYYGDRYLELFIDENGETSFGVLTDDVAVLRTSKLSGSVEVVNEKVEQGGTMTITASGGMNGEWLDTLQALGVGTTGDGNFAYVCLVDDNGREVQDRRDETQKESDTTQFYLMRLDQFETTHSGVLLTGSSDAPPMQRGYTEWMNDLIRKFDFLRINTTWDIRDLDIKGPNGSYSLQCDLKGKVSIHSVLSDKRRIEIENDFDFEDIKLNAGSGREVEIPVLSLENPLKLGVGGVRLSFGMKLIEGENVDASMSGSMKTVFNTSGMSGGMRIDHVDFQNTGAQQRLVLEMGPSLRVHGNTILGASLTANARTRVELLQGLEGTDEIWHACGTQCVEGTASEYQSLEMSIFLELVVGRYELYHKLLGDTVFKNKKMFFHSETFDESGEGPCPFKGYKTYVRVVDVLGYPVEINSCSYYPSELQLKEKAYSQENPGVLYIPASDSPVTVTVNFIAPDGKEKRLSQQIVKKACTSEVIFRLEQQECRLIYDDDNDPAVKNMPQAASCDLDEFMLISSRIPVKEGYRFMGWSFKPKSDNSRQVNYCAEDIFWMSPELVDESGTVTLYPVWEKNSYLYYTGGEGVENLPPTGVNQTLISSVVPTRKEGGVFIGWKKEGDILPHLPSSANPFYPGSGTLEAWFVDADVTMPKVKFHKGHYEKEGLVNLVLNMPRNITYGIIPGVPFKLPTNVPFLVELDFWRADIPQFFVGWSLLEDAKIPQFLPGMDFVVPPYVNEITLYAVWVNVPDFYMLSYDANGGKGAPRLGLNAKKISKTVPTRAGHVFEGWVRKADLNDQGNPKPDAVLYQPGDDNPFYETVEENGKQVRKYRSGTLYAAWKESDRVYTVSFDARGGSNAPQDVTAEVNTPVIIPAQLPLPPADSPASQFAGWESIYAYDDVYQPGDSYTGDADVTLYAVWKTDEFTVYYDANGGDPASAPKAQTFAADDPLCKLRSEKPVREGYVFKGWSPDSGAELARYQPGDLYEDAQSVTLYAVWSADSSETCIITYDANGGEYAPQPQHAQIGQMTALSEQIPIRENHAFVGWTDDPDTALVNYRPGEAYSFERDVTLYAVWTEDTYYAVTYDANGGEEDSVPAMQTVPAGKEVTLSTQIPRREGYVFAGWANDPGAEAAGYQPGSTHAFTDSITLYAVWTLKEDAFYTVTYDANGGEAGSVPKAQSAMKGKSIELAPETPVRANHIFMGWAVSAQAEQDEYQPGDLYTGTQDVTLYAVWSRDAYRIYTVHYDANGGDAHSVPADESAFKGEMITLSSQIPTRLHYDFAGWAYAPDAPAADFAPGAAFTAAQDTTLYALWQIKPGHAYTLLYDANGGEGAPPAQTGIAGEPVMISMQEPTRDYHRFKGWATSPAEETAQYTAGEKCLINGTVTLFALWEADETQMYTVTYRANGGDETSVPAQQRVLLGEKARISDRIPVRDKHVFMGWATLPDAQHPQFDAGETFMCSGDLDLYAVWTPDDNRMYTVTYDANGGKGAPKMQSAFDDTKIQLAPETPVRNGYAFLGWAGEKGADAAAYQPGGAYPGDDVQPPYKDAVLYAVWEGDPQEIYTVTYDANGGTGAPGAQTEVRNKPMTLSGVRPVWMDYTFKGWAPEKGADAAVYQPGDLYEDAQSVTLYAVWDKGEAYCLITYHANGGEPASAPAAQLAGAGQRMTLAQETPAREGYAFMGWALSADAQEPAFQPGGAFVPQGDTDLYAVWEDETQLIYTVTYDANGGTDAPEAQAVYRGEPLTITTQEPVFAGRAFLGWAENKTDETPAYQPGGTFTPESDMTLYALWEDESVYTVTYDAGGSSAQVPPPQTELRGTKIILSQNRPIDREYRFMGWALSSGSTLPAYQPGDVFPEGEDYQDTTLYAVWDKDPDGLYTVTYDANGGTSAPAAQTALVGSRIEISGQKPVRQGYRFIGWAQKADAETLEYGQGDLFPANDDIALQRDTTLYAVWQPDLDLLYTVTYDLNGGEGDFPAQSALIGSSVKLHGHKPVRSLHAFAGWALERDAQQAALEAGETCSFTRNVRLYAVWDELRYTVRFDANGGMNAPDALSAVAGTAVQLPGEAQSPTRAGHRFMGWAAKRSAAQAEYPAGGSYTGDADITLYAVWQADPDKLYTVTYHANGGDEDSVPAPQSALIGEPLTLSMNRPYREAYTFGGWMRTADGTQAEFQPGQYYSESQSMDLYALWTKDLRTIVFDANGGTGGPGSQSFTGERAAIAESVPFRENYRFEGWALSPQGEGGVCALPGAVFTWPQDNRELTLTLYAVWTHAPEVIPDLPETGDQAGMAMWFGLLALCGCGAFLLRRRGDAR